MEQGNNQQEACNIKQDEVFINLQHLVIDAKEVTTLASSIIGVFDMGSNGKELLFESPQ